MFAFGHLSIEFRELRVYELIGARVLVHVRQDVIQAKGEIIHWIHLLLLLCRRIPTTTFFLLGCFSSFPSLLLLLILLDQYPIEVEVVFVCGSSYFTVSSAQLGLGLHVAQLALVVFERLLQFFMLVTGFALA